ncbi:DCN1-like protein 4 [Actinomortierella ambigua]|nr:DCN1-like protein 4 [Actinomortierella ambigua]
MGNKPSSISKESKNKRLKSRNSTLALPSTKLTRTKSAPPPPLPSTRVTKGTPPPVLTVIPTPKAAPISTVRTIDFYEARCLTWFKSYTGLEDEDFGAHQIGPNGISKLCDDIGISLAAIDILVLAYKLEADTMPIFTEDEWTKGMKKLDVDSSKKLEAKMPELVAKLKEPQEFKNFYRYVFMFVKDSEQKCMAIDTAIGILGTVLGDRRHVKKFLEFLEVKRPVKVINKDQWYSLLDFTESVAEDFSDYDEANSAWPVLFDDFVEWSRKA